MNPGPAESKPAQHTGTLYLFILLKTPSFMNEVSKRGLMSVINERGVAMLQSEAGYSFKCNINFNREKFKFSDYANKTDAENGRFKTLFNEFVFFINIEDVALKCLVVLSN